MFRGSVDGVGTKEVEGLGTEGTTGISSSLGFLSTNPQHGHSRHPEASSQLNLRLNFIYHDLRETFSDPSQAINERVAYVFLE